MADAAYSRRDFAGGAAVTTLAGTINSSALSISITDATGWPSGTNGEFFVVINKGQSTEEKVLVESRTSTTLTVPSSGRGVDGTSAAAHDSGESIELCMTARDLDEANKAVAELILPASGAGLLPITDGANSFDLVDVSGDAKILVGNGTTATSVSVSGDATLSNTGALTIEAGAVETGMMASSSIVTSKISDLNVTTGKLADAAVTSAKLASAVAGDGLAGGAGTALSVNVDDSSIEISSDTLQVKAAGVTAAMLAAAARPRWIAGPFHDESVALGMPDGTFSALAAVIGEYAYSYVPTEAGSITGLSVALNTTRTAGSVVFEVTINGVGTGLTVTIDGSNTQHHYATQSAGTDTFSAGDRIGLEYAGTSWDATSSAPHFAAFVHCQTT